jgi:CO/xanthine dehydrogenase FAD-binding subunit
VARTPSDRPVVAAYATAGSAGDRVALCGVGPRPLLAGRPLNPPSDFRGSAEYRLAMAEVVAARALAEARGQ